ncbi:MAG: tRNA pseudouridine(55) synthase TruB [bacterium]|nr:tRNA pseudouridine(55) synthase TruB [bacterium]
MAKTQDGLILIDKPAGMTSFDVIRVLRKRLGIRKMGHAGTLDPRATGLLIIGVNEGTKKLTALVGLPKVYDAEILLGIATDSGDLDGKVVDEKPVPPLVESAVRDAVLAMKGEHDLAVSLYSAIKKDGKPLYKYAREGIAVEQPVRHMVVRNALFYGYDAATNVVRASFDVSSGTYVRSLAEELGKRLGTVATLKELRRVSIGEHGEYHVENAMTVA